MKAETAPRSRLAIDLQREFDNGFAGPKLNPAEGITVFLNIRVAGEALAVPMLDITGVAKLGRILPLPTHLPGLLGVMALRGTIIPVYDLAVQLGMPAGGTGQAWLLFANRETPIALSFDKFEGQVELGRSSVYEHSQAASEGSPAHEHLRSVARLGADLRAVVDIPGILKDIRKAAGVVEPVKETYTK